MHALLVSTFSLVLAGTAPVKAPWVAVQDSESGYAGEYVPAPDETARDPVKGRLATYFSTACCGSMVCGGCTCMPFGLLIPLALLATSSLYVIAAGAALGGAVFLLGLLTAGTGAVGYAVILITLHQMGLWDAGAAAQSCMDVFTIFSACWSIF